MNNVFIPKKINVGFQNRSDTYTGKLSYIIYYDESDVLRKEPSWSKWRDQKISNEVYDNVPTEGFVLNKKVGGYQSHWNYRQSYTRVYDPRGFEFEITIENLLYILENSNSIKGKGLEGEFVYGWDGKDLILLPCEASDYNDYKQYTNTLFNKETIGTKDLKMGYIYVTKDNKECVYLGKFDYYESRYYNDYKPTKKGKRFWFGSIESRWNGDEYIFIDNFTSINKKFIKCNGEMESSKYSEMLDKLESCEDFSPVDKSNVKYRKYTVEDIVKEVNKLNSYLDIWSNDKEKSFYLFNKIESHFEIFKDKDRQYIKENFTEEMAQFLIDEYSLTKKIVYLQNGKELRSRYE